MMKGNKEMSKKCIKDKVVFFMLNSYHLLVMLKAPNFRETDQKLSVEHNLNGKLSLCPPQKQAETKATFKTVISQSKFKIWHIRRNIYIQETKFTARRQYLFGLLFSGNLSSLLPCEFYLMSLLSFFSYELAAFLHSLRTNFIISGDWSKTWPFLLHQISFFFFFLNEKLIELIHT